MDFNSGEFVPIEEGQDETDVVLGVDSSDPFDFSRGEFVPIEEGTHTIHNSIPPIAQDFDVAVRNERDEADAVAEMTKSFNNTPKEFTDLQSSPDSAAHPMNRDSNESVVSGLGGVPAMQFQSEKFGYIWDTAFGQSMTGMVIRGSIDAGLEEGMETDLTMSDKVMRTVMSLGMDSWSLFLGGALPRVMMGAENVARSLPIFTKAAPSIIDGGGVAAKMMSSPIAGSLQAGSSLGFYQATREAYTQRVFNAGGYDPKDYPELIGRGLWDIVGAGAKGFAVGSVAGKGQMLRDAIGGNGIAWAGKYFTGILAESTIIGLLQSQLDDPGRLPTTETFIEALATDTFQEAISFMSPGGAARGMHVKRNWYTDQYKTIYDRHGAHPHTVAEDAHSDVTVMEDLTNVNRENIRRYDDEGGLQEQKSEIGIEYDDAVTASKIPEDIAAPKPDDATADPVTYSDPVPLHVPDGFHTPIKLYEGDAKEAILAPDGRRVIVPTTRGRSLALSEGGMVRSPTIMRLVKTLTGKLPDLEGMKKGRLGYFSSDERERFIKINETKKRIKSLKAKRKVISNRGDQDASLPVYDANISKLNRELSDINKIDDISAKGARMAISIESAKTRGGLVATLTHETGHLLDYMSNKYRDGWGRSSITDPMVGSHIMSYFDDVGDMIKHSQDLGVSQSDITREAAFLSRLWRPTTTEKMSTAYREKASELTADIVSVRLNNPDLMREWAPNIAKVFDEFYKSRPEVADRLRMVEKDLADGKSYDVVEAMMKEDFAEAEYKKADSIAKDPPSERPLNDTWLSKIARGGIDKYSGAIRAVKNNMTARNAMQRHQYVSTFQDLYMNDMYDGVLRDLEDAGLPFEDFGMVMFYNRVAHDDSRAQLANSYGFKGDDAVERLDQKFTEVLKNNGIDLQKSLKKMHEVRQNSIVKLADASGLFSDAFMDTMKNRESYARFELKKYFEEATEDGMGNINTSGESIMTSAEAIKYAQKGSFKEIINPLAATIKNDLELYDRILKTTAKKEVLIGMFNVSHLDPDVPIVPAEEFDMVARTEPYRFGPYGEATMRKHVLSFPERREILDDRGKKTGKFRTVRRAFHVPPDVYKAFGANTPSATQQLMARVSQSTFTGLAKQIVTAKGGSAKVKAAVETAFKANQNANKYFRFFVVTAKMTFQTANPLYDAKRLHRNIPGVNKLALYSIPFELGKHYTKAMRDSYKATWHNDMSKEQRYLHAEGLVSNGMRFMDDATDTSIIERQMYQYGIKGQYENKVGSVVSSLNRGFEYINDKLTKVFETTEMMHKQAALSYLNEQVSKGKLDMSKDEIDMFVRTGAGSPAYLIRGTETTMLNSMMPFLNTIKEGVRGDYQAFKNDKASMTTKVILNTMLPTAALTLLEVGAFDSFFGDEEDENYIPPSAIVQAGTTEWVRDNKAVIPISMSPEGNGFCITIPQDQEPAVRMTKSLTRSLVKSGYKAYLSGDPEGKEFMGEIFGAAKDLLFLPGKEMPGFSPLIGSGMKAASIVKGNNYFDSYSGTMALSDSRSSEVESSLSEKSYEILMSTMKTMGTPSVITQHFKDNKIDELLGAINHINNPSAEDNTKTLGESFLRLVGSEAGKQVFGAYLSYGDYGSKEAIYRAGKKHKVDLAKRRIIAGQEAENMLESQLKDEKYIPKSPLNISIVKSMRQQLNKGLMRNTANKSMVLIKEAGTNPRKLDAVYKILKGSRDGRKFLKENGVK